MKNLSDERLEKLLNDYCEAEPEQSFVFDPNREEEKIIPFAMYRKQLVAAASLVLVSVLSVALYFLLGNKINTPIAVAPSPHSVTTPSTPWEGSDGTIPDDPQDGTEATEAPSALQQIINSIFRKPTETQSNGTSPTTVSPTEKGKSNGRTQPSETAKTNPTQGATEKSATNPTQPVSQPTQSAAQPTQAPVRPTQPPAIPTVPADPPWTDPTENYPDPWEPTERNPGEPEVPEPTEDGKAGAPGDVKAATLKAEVSTSLLNADHDVYCKVYDSRGRLLGSKNLYDASHVAYVRYQFGEKTEVEYEAPIALFAADGYYNYVFYNENGKMLAQNQVYIKR